MFPDKIKNRLKRNFKRQHLRVLTFLFLLFLLTFSLWCLSIFFTDHYSQSNSIEINEVNLDENTLFTDKSEPVKIYIPSINLEADFESPLNIDKNNNMEAPENFDKVARYIFAPTPGELGPSVILGHVDSKEGPAIFYSLGQVKKGDEIIIKRDDKKELIFEIFEIERIKQNNLPTQKVYGDISYAGIRLITCSGYYNKGTLRYSHNLILYGKLIEIK